MSIAKRFYEKKSSSKKSTKIKNQPDENLLKKFSLGKKERYAIKYTKYESKKVSQKKWSAERKNKDGSITIWGVSRQGHRFKSKFFTVKTKKKIKEIFYEAQKESKGRGNTVTIYATRYIGKIDKKTWHLKEGERSAIRKVQVGTKRRKVLIYKDPKTKKKTRKTYLYNTTPDNLIMLLDTITTGIESP